MLRILIFSALILLIYAQSCRNYFQYKQGNFGDTEGLVTIYFPQLTEHKLTVVLSIGASLPSNYVGELNLVKGTQDSANDLRNGQPLLYSVRFPIQYPLPKVSEIYHNDVLICRGEKAISSFVTTVTLYHFFRVDVPAPFYNSPYGFPQRIFGVPQTTSNPFVDLNYQTYQPYQPPTPPKTTRYSTTASPRQTSEEYFEEKIRFTTPSTPERTKIISSNLTEQCGIRVNAKNRFTGLVIKGSTASRTDFPWLVAHYTNQFICGGSLISNKLILTAAHCIWEKGNPQPLEPHDSTYYIGKYKLYDLNENGYVSSDVQKFIVHPNWNASEETYNSDVAIAVLIKTIIFSNTIRPICLWTQGNGHQDLIGQKGLVAGWGITENGGVSEIPKFISTPVVDDLNCLKESQAIVKSFSRTSFCVGDKSGLSACKGDSGGAFAVKYGNQYYLRGIVSSAILDDNGDCSKDDYTVFTDVSYFSKWIKQHVDQYSV